MRKTTKNEKVIRAITIALATMITVSASPITVLAEENTDPDNDTNTSESEGSSEETTSEESTSEESSASESQSEETSTVAEAESVCENAEAIIEGTSEESDALAISLTETIEDASAAVAAVESVYVAPAEASSRSRQSLQRQQLPQRQPRLMWLQPRPTSKWDKDLEECAYIRAEEITISFDHTRPSGEEWYTIFPGMLLGENICKGSEHADMVMEDWLKNQPDRENFLSDEFTAVAIAVYVDSEGQYYWI